MRVREKCPSKFPQENGAAGHLGPVVTAGWRLPSGQTLAEFGLRSGLVGPRLLKAGIPANRSGCKEPA